MRIVILTSSRKGTAAYCLPLLLQSKKNQVVLVIYNEGSVANRWKNYKRIIKKTMRIGIPGALNGIRMREWYSFSNNSGLQLEDLASICEKNNIRFETTPAINSKHTYDLMVAAQADIGLSLGNSYIGKKIFSVPAYGMLNIHGEVLPQFQNAQSVIWQLYENSAETGYTIHKIDSKIDTGDIIKQERFPILFRPTLRETVQASTAEILRRAGQGLVEVLEDFEAHNKQSRSQGAGKKYTTPGFFQFLRILRNFKKLKAGAIQK